MANNSIGKGALTLTVNSAQLQAGLDKAKNAILGLGTAFVGGFGVSAFFNSLSEAGDRAEQVLNLAEAFNTTAENMQAIQGAAKLAGVETESLTKALRAVGELIGEAELGTAEAGKKLGLLGLLTGDVAGKDPVQVLTLILDKMKQIGSEGQQLKIAGDIFGGKNSLAALTLMRAELGKVADELKQSGGLANEATLKQLDYAADAMGKIWMWMKKIKDETLAGFSSLAFGDRPLSDQEQVDALSKHLGTLYERLSEVQKKANSESVNIWGGATANKPTTAVGLALNEIEKYEKALARVRDRIRLDIAWKDAEKLAASLRFAADESERLAKASSRALLAGQSADIDVFFKAFKSEIDAASPFIVDPITKMENALKGLDLALASGLPVDQYNASLLRLAQSLNIAKDAASDLKLPSAIMGGTVESANFLSRQSAMARFGSSTQPGSAQEKIAEALKNAEASDKRKEKLLERIADKLDPLQEWEGI